MTAPHVLRDLHVRGAVGVCRLHGDGHPTVASRLNLSMYTRAGCYLGSNVSASLPPGDSNWTPLSVSIALPAQGNAQICAGALPAYVEIHLESGAPAAAGGGTVWFDDVTFGETP